MRKAPLVLMLIASVAFVSTAEAKIRDKSWEVGAFVGHVDGSSNGGVDNGEGFGLTAGYCFSPKVEVEALLQRNSADVSDHDAQFTRLTLGITATFLADRETRTLPYVSAGLGTIQEKIYAYTDDRSGTNVRVAESFDASALLTIGVGARTFFSENWAVRYEVRFNHHQAFDEGQDEYEVHAGITWVVGGQK